MGFPTQSLKGSQSRDVRTSRQFVQHIGSYQNPCNAANTTLGRDLIILYIVHTNNMNGKKWWRQLTESCRRKMEKTHTAEQGEQGAKNTHEKQCTYRQPLASPKTPGSQRKGAKIQVPESMLNRQNGCENSQIWSFKIINEIDTFLVNRVKKDNTQNEKGKVEEIDSEGDGMFYHSAWEAQIRSMHI